VTPTAVIQTKQGVGDVVWHLPFIRAIAAGGSVTFLAPPSSRAKELLQAEPCVGRTLYFENRGSALKRGLEILRLIRMLRLLRFQTVWVLDRSAWPAFCAWIARVPNRIGVGYGVQRFFITNRPIARHLKHGPHIEWLKALMSDMNIDCATEPKLELPARLVNGVSRHFGKRPRPWVVLALGGSHSSKDWPMTHWVEFVTGVRERTGGTVFIVGGLEQHGRAQALIDSTRGAQAINACRLKVIEAAALLHEADVFLGPDSGLMNLAAGVGIPAFGLFGATRVLDFSRFIHPIRPDDGAPPTPDGMKRISAQRALQRIEPYLVAGPASAATD